MAEQRTHEETVRRFQEMFEGSLDKGIIQSVLQKNYYNAESSLTELLHIAESNRDRKSEESPTLHTGVSREESRAKQLQGADMMPVTHNQQSQQAPVRHQMVKQSPAGGHPQYRPYAHADIRNPSHFNNPYVNSGGYNSAALSSAPSGYGYKQLVSGSQPRMQTGTPSTQSGAYQPYRQTPSMRDQSQMEKARVGDVAVGNNARQPDVYRWEQQRQNVSQSYSSGGRGRGFGPSIGYPSGRSMHEFDSNHSREGKTWSTVAGRPGNWQRYGSSEGRNGDWTKPGQDGRASGKLLFIIRGLPGSGKTTLAKQLAGLAGRILSTDDFFYNRNGRYMYDVTRIGEAHDWNQRRADQAMARGETPIVIDNTNCMKWEMKPYVKSGRRFGYRVELHEPQTEWKFDPWELSKRNVHGVPLEKIQIMLERYEHNVTIESLFDSQRSISSLSRSSLLSRPNDRHSVKRTDEKSLLSLPVSTEQLDSGSGPLSGQMSFNPSLLRSGSHNSISDETVQTKKEEVVSEPPQQMVKVQSHTKASDVEALPPLESDNHDVVEVNETRKEELLPQPAKRMKEKSLSSLPAFAEKLESGTPTPRQKVKVQSHTQTNEVDELPPLEAKDEVVEMKQTNNVSGAMGLYSSSYSTGLSTGEVRPPSSNFNSSLLSFKSNPVPLPMPLPNVSLPLPLLGSLSSGNQQGPIVPVSMSGDLQGSGVSINVSTADSLAQPVFSVNSVAPVVDSVELLGLPNASNDTQSTELVANAASSVKELAVSQSESFQDNSRVRETERLVGSVLSQSSSGEAEPHKHQIPITAASISSVPSPALPNQLIPSSSCSSALEYVPVADPTASLFDSLQRQGSSTSIPARLSGSQSYIASLSGSLSPHAATGSGVLSNEEFLEMLKNELDNQPDDAPNELSNEENHMDIHAIDELDTEYEQFNRLVSDVKRSTASMSAKFTERDIQQPTSYDFVNPRGSVGALGAETNGDQLLALPDVEPKSIAHNVVSITVGGNESSHESEQMICGSNGMQVKSSDASVIHQHENRDVVETLGGAVMMSHDVKSLNDPGVVLVSEGHDVKSLNDPGVVLVSEGDDSCRENDKSMSLTYNRDKDTSSVSHGIAEEKGATLDQPSHSVDHDQQPSSLSNKVPVSSPDAPTFSQPEIAAVADTSVETSISIMRREAPHTVEHPNITASLDFLTSCFPDYDRDTLRQMLEENQYDVTLTSNMVLEQQAAEMPQHATRAGSIEASARRNSEDASDDDDFIMKQKDIDDNEQEQQLSDLDDIITADLDLEIAHSLTNETLNHQPDVINSNANTPLEYSSVYGDSESKRKKTKQMHKDELMAKKLQAEFDSKSDISLTKSRTDEDVEGMAWQSSVSCGLDADAKRVDDGADSWDGGTAGRMCLKLDETFARRMQEMFGQVPFTLTPEDYTIDLGEKFSRKLYRKWVAGLEEKYNPEVVLVRRIMKKDEDLARKLQAEEENKKMKEEASASFQPRSHQVHKKSAASQSAGGEKKSVDPFAQIIDEQLAVEIGKKERVKMDVKLDMATVLKQKELYAMFPLLDKETLNEIFSANDFAVGATVNSIKQSCGLEPKKTELSDELLPSKPTSSRNKRQAAEDVGGVYQETDAPAYVDFRAEAQLHAKQREECLRKAAEAFAKKQGELSQYYLHQGHLHAEKMHEANRRASAKIFESENVGKPPLEFMDLHMLHVTEAIEALQNTFACIKAVEPQRRPRHLTVVTGKGLHSKSGRARVKPAVINYLRQHGYRYQEVNAGRIRIDV